MTLDQWMKREKLTDEQMSARLGGKPSRSQINRIRRRECAPKLHVALALQGMTGIPAEKLFGAESEAAA